MVHENFELTNEVKLRGSNREGLYSVLYEELRKYHPADTVHFKYRKGVSLEDDLIEGQMEFNEGSIGKIITQYEEDVPNYIRTDMPPTTSLDGIDNVSGEVPFISELALALSTDGVFDNKVYSVGKVTNGKNWLSEGYHRAIIKKYVLSFLKYIPSEKIKNKLSKVKQKIKVIATKPYTTLVTTYLPDEGSTFDDFEVRAGSPLALILDG